MSLLMRLWGLWLLAAVTLALAFIPAYADQPIYQTGTALTRHLPVFQSNGRIKDSGNQLGLPGGGIDSFAVINSTVTRPGCFYDANPSIGPAHSLCIGPSGITVQRLGGASPSSFEITVDGVVSTGVGTVTNSLNLANNAIVLGEGGTTGVRTTTTGTGVVTALGVNVGQPGAFLSSSVADQTVTGGANVISQTQAAGNITIDCGKNPAQYIANVGAFIINAPVNDGYCFLDVENGVGAGVVTVSGFAPNSIGGAPLDTTNGHIFRLYVSRVHGHASVDSRALQ